MAFGQVIHMHFNEKDMFNKLCWLRSLLGPGLRTAVKISMRLFQEVIMIFLDSQCTSFA